QRIGRAVETPPNSLRTEHPACDSRPAPALAAPFTAPGSAYRRDRTHLRAPGRPLSPIGWRPGSTPGAGAGRIAVGVAVAADRPGVVWNRREPGNARKPVGAL